MRHTFKIAASLLSSDFSNLEKEVKRCGEYGADWLHVDVMDGHFVPNITIGPLVVEAIKKHSDLPIDCHLMISEPDKYIESFSKAGADYISIHAEGAIHLHRSLELIKKNGCSPGLALNPVTPLEFAFEAAPYVDFILLMSVNPGFGGQSFIPSFIDRCKRLRHFLDKNGFVSVEIQVDGGIKPENVDIAVKAGANIIVSGSGLFNGDLNANIKKMKLNASELNF